MLRPGGLCPDCRTVGGLKGFAGAGSDTGGPGTAGLFLGRTSARQIWNGPIGSEELKGVSAGVFADVQTPLSVLSIRAGAGYSGRGGAVWDEVEDPGKESVARVRSHYLSLPLHGVVELGLGPLAGYAFGGPTVDFLLSSECSAQFCQFIREEKTTGVSVAVGVGLALDLPRTVRTYLEWRLTEGLGDAYLGDRDSARNRTVEILVRMGRAF